jgi:hypothetical protein
MGFPASGRWAILERGSGEVIRKLGNVNKFFEKNMTGAINLLQGRAKLQKRRGLPPPF